MLLALDTSQAACSVGLWQQSALRAGHYEAMRRGHAEALMDRIDTQLSHAGTNYDNLSGILVTTGPGTFTGQRVGLAAARGLGLGLNIPVIGLSTFEAIAAALIIDGHQPGECHIVFDARRDEVYHQSFDLSDALPKPLTNGAIMSIDEAQSKTKSGNVVGSGAALIAGDLPIIDGYDYPDASKFGWYGQHISAGPDRLARPFYLRAPDAKPPSAPPAPRSASPPSR